ncbi:hypothetical protein CSC94_01670 [Zhengella mangrovi]|uniref:DUF2244 domain-containing protein n=1 Tax=Zhengella mangrovi TaxID=1982044 RepID=A0A2G1QTE0_9HYPH|nr:DUF2244 domain-containing protein [Zhengella mangrovi]PHP68729.1 hypothetical protein CSC94_01670 [Zhengella mangrovi]
MSQATAVDSEEPVFDALLTPHRSMGRTGFYVVMGICAFVWLASGLLFLMKGAWPVFGFFGLDVIALYIAFRMNYRAARAREEVRIWRHHMLIRKIAPSGKVADHHFNPFWAKFQVTRHEEIGVTGMAVTQRGLSVPVGSFLNPDDRETFSQAFGGALARVKRG